MRVRAAFSVLTLLTFGFLGADEEIDSKELSRLVEILDVDPGERFADVGAGDGRYSVALARAVGESGRIYATEVDPDDLTKIEERVSREKLSNVEVVRGTQEATGLSEACCDGILLRRVYHHFQNPGAMQASMRRSLKDSGLLLIVDFGTRRSWDRPEGVPESREGHGIDKDVLVSEMELAGFGLVRDLPWEDGDYALLFRAVAVPD
ncbi:MAG TPA: methyltransferase domain-containing protein [Vicinamibacteria bacterium]|nr:methyltransferase domain-containing protein [Vicinamibacteria bacterium]